jgi:hypothetical protein
LSENETTQDEKDYRNQIIRLIEDWFCGPGERSLDDAEVQFLVEFIQRVRELPAVGNSKSPQCLAAGFISLLAVREDVSRAEQTKALAEYFKVDQRTITVLCQRPLRFSKRAW